ncbi:flagellar biosynthesis repressor FlbT [Paracoccus aerodenitrificans]|uniref:flagellar biosynthesis repressor FlbT n=1 Tax=Paracoccus aerodenitrificans TaxID=3017781 RepID=UPI0022F13E96|nr:flagellar biosynthesis repressor FlbT [Paracoccus aerodenitrificans]WBU64304.1 flagellar biosynthesis repressor FlbT [Paracoccus aerodenitrificans]
MTGLVLKLAPNERVLINGAVIENGERRGCISIKTPKVNILRLRDAIHPEDATTPVSRACYDAQLVLSGDRDNDKGRRVLLRNLEQLSQVFEDRDSRKIIAQATSAVIEENFYRALRLLRDLLPREARLLAAAK